MQTRHHCCAISRHLHNRERKKPRQLGIPSHGVSRDIFPSPCCPTSVLPLFITDRIHNMNVTWASHCFEVTVYFLSDAQITGFHHCVNEIVVLLGCSTSLVIQVAARTKAWVCRRLIGLRVRIPPAAWMYDSCMCCRGLCFWPITRPEESYRVWCDCDREASIMKECRAL